jgi:hypothetical protein
MDQLLYTIAQSCRMVAIGRTKLYAEGRQVRVALPPEPETDFNDVLMADVSAPAEARRVA